MEYLCSKCSRIYSFCSNNYAVFSSFMTYHVCNKSNTTGAICGAGIVTHTEHLSSTSVFDGVHVAQSLFFCVIFCRSVFVLFFWPLCCLSFFDLRLLITPLVSSFFSNNNLKFKQFKITKSNSMNNAKLYYR